MRLSGSEWEVLVKTRGMSAFGVENSRSFNFWHDFTLGYLKDTVPQLSRACKKLLAGGTSPSNETDREDAVFKFSEGLKGVENEVKKIWRNGGFGKSEVLVLTF